MIRQPIYYIIDVGIFFRFPIFIHTVVRVTQLPIDTNKPKQH